MILKYSAFNAKTTRRQHKYGNKTFFFSKIEKQQLKQRYSLKLSEKHKNECIGGAVVLSARQACLPSAVGENAEKSLKCRAWAW